MDLETLLEVHIASIRKLVVESGAVPPGGDIASMCGAWRDDGTLITVGEVRLSPDPTERQSQHEAVMQWLKDQGAAAYTWAAAAWSATIRLDELTAVRSSGVQARPDRQEVIACVVGDRHQTLSTELAVTRDRQGRIVELTAAAKVSRTTTGLFHDLMRCAIKTSVRSCGSPLQRNSKVAKRRPCFFADDRRPSRSPSGRS